MTVTQLATFMHAKKCRYLRVSEWKATDWLISVKLVNESHWIGLVIKLKNREQWGAPPEIM